MEEKNWGQPVQPQSQQPVTEPVAAASQTETTKCQSNLLCGCKCLKILLFSLLGVVLVGGLVFTGIKIGKGQLFQKSPLGVCGTPLLPRATLQPTSIPDETANWKTYSDPEVLKISIKYPPNWQVVSEAHLGKNAPAFMSPCDFEKGERCASLIIEKMEYLKDRSLEDYFVQPEQIIRKESLKLGGEDALLREYLRSNDSGFENEGVFQTMVVLHDGKPYSFLLGEKGKDALLTTTNDWQYRKTFDQILATFKFID